MFNKINSDIREILGINALPEEKQNEMMEKMGGLVYQEIMLRALDQLTEEEKDEFEKLITENNDPEAMFSYREKKVPDIENIAHEEAEKFKADSANIMSQIG